MAIEEIGVESWEHFQDELRKLADLRTRLVGEIGRTYVSNLLFRGQGGMSWKLSTTLERYTGVSLYLLDEYRKVTATVKSEIETFTDHTWEVASLTQFANKSHEQQDHTTLLDLIGLEYMVYLRHHGFPSPLLDWTRSPYVASFFAFNTIPNDTTHVSIYAYLEFTGKGKSFCTAPPHILSIGPSKRTHKRHFLQQCEYTYCVCQTQDGIFFANHADGFNFSEREDQDRLWKFNVPASERLTVLKILDSMNLNSFSLFLSEESLLEILALRKFYLDGYI